MNDYHAAFKEMVENHGHKGQQWFGKRQYLVNRYSWAVPNDDVLTYIADTFDHVNEVGAGRGYWAAHLDARGVSVDAFDNVRKPKTFHEIEHVDATSLEQRIVNEPLLMVWPPVDDNLAEVMARKSPSHVLYVGEGRGGCTAADGFFDVLDKYYGLVEEIDIPSYEGVHDNFYHYTRKV